MVIARGGVVRRERAFIAIGMEADVFVLRSSIDRCEELD